MPGEIVNSAAISVENLVFATLTDDVLKTYGIVTPISPLINIKVTPASSSAVLYADGRAVERATAPGEISVEFEVQDLPLPVQAVLLGHDLNPLTGVMTDNADDVAPYVALGFKIKKANGKYRHIWLLKGSFEDPSVEAATQADKVSFSTPKLKGGFIDRADGNRKFTADDDAGTTPVVGFLGTVYSPGV